VKRFLVFVVVVVVCVAGLGFYRGWFSLSTDQSDNKSDVTISVDRDKVRGDEDKVKESVHELGKKTSEKVSKETTPPGTQP